MDSGTHFVVGLGLAGLATVDPVVYNSPVVFSAVLIGTVVGSQAPDFDSFLRLKSNAAYIRNHRGITHSLPAIVIWTVLITAALQIGFRGLPWLHVGGWVLLAVLVHIFSDLFNTYGTQAARPFSQQWIAWNIIHIFDPVIFTTHVMALLLWAFDFADPRIIFPVLYGFTALYYVWRTFEHRRQSAALLKADAEAADGEEYLLIPTVSLFDWNVVKRMKDGSFRVGDFRGGKLKWADFASCSDHPAVEISKRDVSIQAFLHFTSYASAEVLEHSWGYEVRWADVRYRRRKQYPMVGVLVMDSDYKTLGSYVGWLSDERLQKRLRMNTY
ncbi:metal-dependent hydrolase [Paenibacillus beijingensis]|uniref:Hydrolase n=1 Tax=Paenibacillus beijingensis TaxID=1126833 RepID=A0A0D5NKG5_9BACL|nr:metal-dependent hydrolase [Paenibacillus beijingensis]AJY75736.1 hydrolase [Paenibacillus beijingensis]